MLLGGKYFDICQTYDCFDVRYEWYKNGRILSPPGHSGNLQEIKQGTIKIRPLTSLDEGYYHCEAFNQFGRAMSRMTYLRRAVLEHFSGSSNEPVDSEFVNEGEPFSLRCNPAKVFPRPTFTWALAKKDVDTGVSGQQEASQGINVALGKRIQVDENGKFQVQFQLFYTS